MGGSAKGLLAWYSASTGHDLGPNRAYTARRKAFALNNSSGRAIADLPTSATPTAEALDRVRQALIPATALCGFLVAANLGLVYAAIKRRPPPHRIVEEAESQAMESLLRAVDGFKPSKGFKFSTYATGAIYKAVGRAIKISGKVREHNFSDADGGAASMETTAYDGRREIRSDLTEHDRALLRQSLLHALETLDENEKEIFEQRLAWGKMHREKIPTLQELGKVYGLSKERIRQIQSKARKKLAEQLADLSMLLD